MTYKNAAALAKAFAIAIGELFQISNFSYCQSSMHRGTG
jgi:hypothetical protein